MKNERKFVIYYNAERCGVQRGGCVELENGGTFKAWLEEYADIEDYEVFEKELGEWPTIYDDPDCKYEVVPLSELKDEYVRLGDQSNPPSWRLAAEGIATLALHDKEVAAAAGIGEPDGPEGLPREVREWLDENAKVVTDCGNVTYHIDAGGDPVLDENGDCAWIALTYDRNALYTDALDYGNHGLGNGAYDRRGLAAVQAVLPSDVWAELVEAYGDDGDDGIEDTERFEADLAGYLHGRAGWTPNEDYFDRPNVDGWAAIKALDIPHDEDMDETESADAEA